jgi:hypothetical protein
MADLLAEALEEELKNSRGNVICIRSTRLRKAAERLRRPARRRTADAVWNWWDGWGLVKKALALARTLLLYPEAPALTALHDDKGIVCMERRTAKKILEMLREG